MANCEFCKMQDNCPGLNDCVHREDNTEPVGFVAIDYCFPGNGQIVGAEVLSMDKVDKFNSGCVVKLFATPQPAIPVWQPIETPPKEWGSYLIWHPKYGMETLWFQLKDGGNDGRKAGNWYSEEGDDDYPCNARVTHWMPLPAAPKDMKWCSYCGKANHNDSECYNTRPAAPKPEEIK